MPVHISARLAWHDKGWDGCICDDPKSNVSCMVHEHIRESRDDEFETQNAGKSLYELSTKKLPPCSRDPGVFSSTGFKIIHYDPLDWRSLPATEEEIPPYSFCTSPYGRMFSEDGEQWELDPRKQLDNLRDFWDKLEARNSLVLFYVNHGNPLKEEKSDRILVAVGRILRIGPQFYFGKKAGSKDDYPLWSRCVTLSFPEEGVRLPYQEYIDNGYNTSNIVCTIPTSIRPYFSYVAEHVTDDIAVGILERAIQSVKAVIAENKVLEPYGKSWEYRLEWLNKALGEVWKNRGLFPGIGSLLEYLGFKHGITYHRSTLSVKEASGENIFDYVFSILQQEKEAPEDQKNNFERASKKWNQLSGERRKLLRLLSHFELSPEQVERVCNPTKRNEAFIEAFETDIIENPYVTSELDDGGEDSPAIDFETIDRGMIPPEDISKPKGELSLISKDDERRVRAILVEVLRAASQEGDTFLSVDEAINRVRKRLPENRLCEPDREIILHNRKFYEERLSFFPDENPRVVALKSLRQEEEEVKERLSKMVQKEYEQIDNEFWQQLVEKELKSIRVFDEQIERRARAEKAMALDKLFSFRFSVLTGRAGTGKTTVLKVFIRGLEEKEGKQPVLLLAPTGKARVRLQEITGKESQTIHQFIMKLSWIRQETFSLKEKGGDRRGLPTVIIDEASMIPIDLLATLFRAIDFNDVKRLVLVGDPNQLPPIGPGRPFVDIIKWLETSEDKEKHVARLTQRVRHEDIDSQALKLADAFLGDKVSPGDDEILSKVARDEVSGDLEVHFWNDGDEFYEFLGKSLEQNIGLDQDEKPDYEGFNRSIEKPDSWQILSPTRMQVCGTTEINRIIQSKYRQGLIEKAKRYKPRPFGEQQMVWNDKVIQVINSRRTGWKAGKVDGYVANGEVGLIISTDKKYDSFNVKFSTQPDLTYRYHRAEVNENLELAYAITVHKSQGSDFDTVFLILPQNAGAMSRELLYTGLTRFKKKVILLIEKDVAPLLAFRNPQYSEILRRNTHLFELVARPETVGLPHPERLIHRTRKGDLVRSKSEVIVANMLIDLGISYEYERPLYSKKGAKDFRLPDFTVKYEGEEFYWEHLGMLFDPEYKEEWKNKEKWYKENGYYDRVIISKDGPDGRIDSKEIEKLAKEKILGIKP